MTFVLARKGILICSPPAMRKKRFTKEISGFRMDVGLREQQRCGAIRNIIKSSGENPNIIRACTKRKRFTLPEVTEKCR